MTSDLQTAQNLLEQKVQDSYEQLEKERKRSGILGRAEILVLTAAILCMLKAIEFVLWGAGYSLFAPEQHKFTVDFLIKQPGPQSTMVSDAIETDGHISLVDYHRYVAIASKHENATR
ncbi:MAG: hypothetical protein K6L76_02380 [Agarilytica sp.]